MSQATKSAILSDKEFKKLAQIVTDAGKIAHSFYQTELKNWVKEDDTPITEADLAVNAFLETELQRLRKDFGWLSEETIDDPKRLHHDTLWVVDPIDGTKAFLKGANEWVVSVAIVTHGRPVLGMIYNPINDRLYCAQVGSGAFVNGEKIETQYQSELKGAKLCAYESHFNRVLKDVDHQWPDTEYGIVNSMALRVALVTIGRFDAMVSFTNKGEWDMAAADIIIHEAGGKLTDGFGNQLRYNKEEPKLPHMIAAGPELHKVILDHKLRF